jgi:hypothetical protein
MKFRATLLCLALLACAAVPAFAQFPIDVPGQLALAWGDCMPAGAPYVIVDCQDPAGSDALYASLMSGVPITGVIADLGIIDVTAGVDPAALPPYWDFHVGGCSGAANIVFSADFSAVSACVDMWAGLGATGGQFGGESGPTPDGNRARIKWTTVVSPELHFDMPAGPELYIERVTFRHTALPNCAGCQEPVCFVYNEELISDIAGNSWRFTNPGYASANAPPAALNCPGSTPTRSNTWGGVKALYK